MEYKIYNDNCLEVLKSLEDNSVDSIITDPPYGLTSIVKRFDKENSTPAQYGKDRSFARLAKGFMGKEWDGSGIEYNVEMWQECLRILKCGGYLLAFGGTRTYHRIACAIENAGFEIRDCIMWLYGSGFPKSMDLGLAIDKKRGIDNRTGRIKTDGKATNSGSGCYNCNNGIDNSMKKEYEERVAQNEWRGWGTCLKPAYEPIIIARKPFKGSLIDNILENGVGGLNIDECRVGDEHFELKNSDYDNSKFQSCSNNVKKAPKEYVGRFPANVILTYEQIDFDEVCGGLPETKGDTRHNTAIRKGDKNSGHGFDLNTRNEYNNNGSAARYFYCAKASKKDRNEGLIIKTNIHPTVKPTSLMQYLIRLVTPKNGIVLDPFMGSGSTGKAVAYENKERQANYKFIGIEKEKEYCDIAEARIKFANENEKT